MGILKLIFRKTFKTCEIGTTFLKTPLIIGRNIRTSNTWDEQQGSANRRKRKFFYFWAFKQFFFSWFNFNNLFFIFSPSTLSPFRPKLNEALQCLRQPTRFVKQMATSWMDKSLRRQMKGKGVLEVGFGSILNILCDCSTLWIEF